jgi:hypothetical protein
MNTETVVIFGPVTLIAFVIQQIFVIYAIYAIFIRPLYKKPVRDKLLNTIRSGYTRGKIGIDACRNLEKDIINLGS